MAKTVKKAKRLSGPRTLAGALHVVRKFYLDPTIPERDRVGFWAVLSALRGPDEDIVAADLTGAKVKAATTAVVRYALLGAYPAGIAVLRDSPEAAAVRSELAGAESGGRHFIGHVRNAFRALDLTWGKVNQL